MKVNFEPESNFSLGETSFSPDNITINSNIGIDLQLKSWVENNQDYNSDQDKISATTPKNFHFDDTKKL